MTTALPSGIALDAIDRVRIERNAPLARMKAMVLIGETDKIGGSMVVFLSV